MLYLIFLTCLTTFATATPVVAQPTEKIVHSATGVEIGTLFGLSHSPADGTTVIGVPEPLVFSFRPEAPSLYVLWFPSKQLALGPEFSFGVWSWLEEVWSEGVRSEEKTSLSTLYLGGRGAFFLQSNAVSGPYLLGNGALLGLYAEGSSLHAFSTGAGLGYQRRVGPAFVLRVEGRYRRWVDDGDDLFGDGENEFSLFLGLGTRLGGR